MERLRSLGPGRSLTLGASALLLVDTFLPWQTVSLDRFSYSWNAWHGDKGFLLGALTALLLVWTLAAVFRPGLVARPFMASVSLGLAALIVAFAAVKNIRDDDSAWGSYLGVVLAAAVVAGAWLEYRESTATPRADVALPGADLA
jgi:hypothetical protein